MSTAEGTLRWVPAKEHPTPLGELVAAAMDRAPSALVAPIDPALADAAAFCEA